jgi:putative nucleotidyltransferase with HDIG domain
MTINEIFPELEEIQNSLLKEKTANCLECSIEQGGWHLETLEEIPFTLLIPNCPVSLVKHTRLVTQLSLKAFELFEREYSKYYKLNRDFLVSGALLHDVGKFLEYKKEGDRVVKSHSGKFLRHPFSGANIAAMCGLPAEVAHIIAVHAHEGDEGYRSPEAHIVHNADFMNFEPLRDVLK